MAVEPAPVDKILRVAVFGAGNMAMHHIRAISLQKNAKLVAIADPAIEEIRVGRDKEFPPDVSLFSDPEEMLDEVRPDVVHVCTPPETHFRLAESAIRRGANVYVEKPFALSARDAGEIVRLAEGSGVNVCAGHQLLFEEPGRKARSHMEKLGRVVHVESYFSFHPVHGSQDGRPALPPLDQLIDILPHPVYLLLHFMKSGARAEDQDPVRIRSIEASTSGNVHGTFDFRGITGHLVVTLEGRPIESYVKVVGTNGSLFADFVRGTACVHAGPGTSGIAKVIHPYSQAMQILSGTTKALTRRVLKKQKSYPGLAEIIRAFYGRLETGAPMGMTGEDIIETVAVCEEVATRLRNTEAEEHRSSVERRETMKDLLPPVDPSREGVLVTGGSGFLGKPVAAELRRGNRLTRVVSRRIPPLSSQIPGVEYAAADLAGGVPPELLEGISVVVHCAAETSGGMEAHRRNSIEATRNLIAAMGDAGIRKLVYVSSIAVLKTSRETGKPVDENTPLVGDSEDRGPYVWGKAESEKLAGEMCGTLGIGIRVIRPGALVDYQAFEAPGRLGREVGPYFFCIGRRKDRFGLCEVNRAAEIIRAYVEEFDSSPPVLNLIEPELPTHAELVDRLSNVRPDLKILYFPTFLLRLMSPGLKILQKILRPSHKPIDLYAIFAPERYDNDLVKDIVRKRNGSLRNGTADRVAG